MADRQLVQLELTKGLDMVTPPLSIESGSIIDCLNYEMTDIAGYRRIDGYERYDGYPNGAVYDYYRVKITAVNNENQPSLGPGTIISRGGDTTPFVDIGVILADAGDGYFDVTPFSTANQWALTEYFLLQQDDESMIKLQSNDGLLRLIEAGGILGSTFLARTPGNPPFEVLIQSQLISGKTYATDPMDYVQNIRNYGTFLRNQVQDAPGAIAGMQWFRNKLYVAVDLPYVIVTHVDSMSPLIEGTRVRLEGILYRVVSIKNLVDNTSNYTYDAYLLPIGTATPVDDNLVEVDTAGTTIRTIMTGVTAGNLFTSDNSLVATLGYYNNPTTSTTRGFTYLPVSENTQFTNGKTYGPLQPDLTMNGTPTYYIVGTDGTVLEVALTGIQKTAGDFAAGTAAGNLQIIVLNKIAGTRDYVKSTDQLHTTYPTTGTSQTAVISSDASSSILAGTGALSIRNTMYTWGIYNFYGQSGTLTMYGATGVTQAFWANDTGYGTFTAIPDATLDHPKYVSFHSNRLALGYDKGSLLLSVIGDPYNYNGTDGALEIATGDDITGLLEMPGNTLGVFGRRAIRKITGYTDTDMQLNTIAGASGCIDYTAQLVGQTAVYTSVNGITTLDQTQAYGDFIGQRITDKISTWLRPKLVTNRSAFEQGGVIGAYVVRAKGQYRLVLKTGETVIITFTNNGPKCMLLNYSLVGQERIPYCWSSQLGDDGVEHIHTRWATIGLEKRAFELESGWGFDGLVFNHYFTTAHVFSPNSASNLGIEKIRVYGQGFGLSTVYVTTAGIEWDFDQPFSNIQQDISIPIHPTLLRERMEPVTSVVDIANWGLGIKIKIQNTNPEGSDNIEPAHIFQTAILHVRTEGAADA